MKVITYQCDVCKKQDPTPMALFRSGLGGMEWRINGDPEKADMHVCSRECAIKLSTPTPRTSPSSPEPSARAAPRA
jgi:hypothetical protein